MSRSSDPLAAARNIAALVWRRAMAVPKRVVRLARRAERARQQAELFQAEWRIHRELAAIARGRGPIIAGPWLSEVGFEALYWIPFLRWFEDRYRIDASRVIAVSRGGVAEWYGDVAERYVEIFDHVDPATFARRNVERRRAHEAGGQKQTQPSAFDDELIAAAAAGTGARQPAVCHPSLMYRLFNQVWLGNRAADVVFRHTSMAPVLAAPPQFDLPERFVAAKFYTGAALPDTPDCRRALRELVRQAASRMPVVMLDTGLATDEHDDYLFADIPNVVSLRERLTPPTNLGVQTSVVAAAQGFLGTCGSLAWLAPMLGVRTVGVYADERLLTTHLYLARQLYRRMNAAPFETLDLRAVEALDVFAAMAPHGGGPDDSTGTPRGEETLHDTTGMSRRGAESHDTTGSVRGGEAPHIRAAQEVSR